MRPTLQLLDDALVERIVSEAVGLLADPGIAVTEPDALALLTGHGARVSEGGTGASAGAGPSAGGARVLIPDDLVQRALDSAPSSFGLFASTGERTHELGAGALYFTPGSAALTVLDVESGEVRAPTTADYVEHVKVVGGLPHIASQSTALIPGDVHGDVSDSYRLFLSLLHCAKPVVTGTFTPAGFEVMRDLQLAVRGTEEALCEQPLAVFTCCPTSPLSWTDEALQPLLACARAGIPVEVVSMPLAGFTAPVTVVGTLVQHAAEVLSGIVLAQLARPGTPVVYGSSAAIFDVRHGTTPMGAIESMILACGVARIGKRLGLPTQAYIGLSDAKLLDGQAGFETGMGASLAALSDLDQCAGPGMMHFQTCQSLEKLVVDDEICGMALRLRAGVEPRDDFPFGQHAEALLSEGHVMITPHSRAHLREEQSMPSLVVDRTPRARWEQEGRSTLGRRARARADELLAAHEPPALSEEVRRDLHEVMTAAARRAGQERLPEAAG